jgi:hypothetical protein
MKVIRRINDQKQSLSKQISKPLTTATESIRPIAKQTNEMRASIIRSIPYKQIQKQYLPDLASSEKELAGESDKIKELKKTRIIPVALEKPVSELAKAALEIQTAAILPPRDSVSGEKKSEYVDILPRSSQIEKDQRIHEMPINKEQAPMKPKSTVDGPVSDVDLIKPMQPKPATLPVIPLDKKISKKPADREEEFSSDGPAIHPIRIKDLGLSNYFERKREIIEKTAAKIEATETRDAEIIEKPSLKEEFDGESITKLISELVEPNGSGPEKETTEVTSEEEIGTPDLKISGELENSKSDIEIMQTKKSIDKPLTPVLTAIAMLSGSVAGSKKIPRSMQTITKSSSDKKLEAGLKTDITEKEDKTAKEVAMVKDKPSLERPERSERDQISPIQPVTDIIEPDRQIPEPVSTTPRTTVWSSITKAVHRMASLAALVVAADVGGKTRKLAPKAGSLEFIEPPKGTTKVVTGKPDEVIVTADVRRKDTVIELRAPDRKIKPEGEGFGKLDMGTKVPVEMKRVRLKKISRVGDKIPIEPIPAVIPSSTALSMLGLLAKSSAVDDSNLVRIPQRRIARVGDMDALESYGSRTLKHIPTSDAKISETSGLAIGELDKVAQLSKKSLYLDEIKPIKSRILPISKQKEIDRLILKKQAVEGKISEESPIIPGIKRGLRIDEGSSRALGLLNKLVLTTAVARAETIAEVYSKPITEFSGKDIEYSTPKLHSKLPLTRSVTVIPSRPDIEPDYSLISEEFEGSIKPVRRATSNDEPIDEGMELRYKPEPTQEQTGYLDRGKIQPGVWRTRDSDVKAIDLLSLIAKSTGQPRATDRKITGIKPSVKSRIKFKDTASFIRPTGSIKPVSGKTIPQTPDVTIESARRLRSLSEAFGLIRGRYEQRLMARVGLGADIPGQRTEEEPFIITDTKSETGVQFSGSGASEISGTSRISGAGREISGVSATSHVKRFDSKIGETSTARAPELYPTKPPRSEDFDWLPKGAPKKRDENREQIMVLEEKVRILRDRLSEMAPDREPPTKKLQEFVHDPNLQNQLKKLFYESWLENMDKELKRYGG